MEFTTSVKQDKKVAEKPAYQPPRIQAMSESDILKTFQITQSMVGWWTSGACC